MKNKWVFLVIFLLVVSLVGCSKPTTPPLASKPTAPPLTSESKPLSFEEKKTWFIQLQTMDSWMLPKVSVDQVNEQELISYCLYKVYDQNIVNGQYKGEMVYDPTVQANVPKLSKEAVEKVAKELFDKEIKNHRAELPFKLLNDSYILLPSDTTPSTPRIMTYSKTGDIHTFELDYYYLLARDLHTSTGKVLRMEDPNFSEVFFDNSVQFTEKPDFHSTLVLKDLGNKNYKVLSNTRENIK